jgi:hypothetical protein
MGLARMPSGNWKQKQKKFKLNVETLPNNKGSKNARIPSDNWNQRFLFERLFLSDQLLQRS